MHPSRKSVPPEDPQAEEGGLEEERRQALHGKRGTEHVTDEAAVGGPVHPKLELLHQSGHYPNRNVDQQQGSKELGELQLLLVA